MKRHFVQASPGALPQRLHDLHFAHNPRSSSWQKRDVDYYYVSMEEFEKMIEHGGFVEMRNLGETDMGRVRR
jgi:hypothetical protein